MSLKSNGVLENLKKIFTIVFLSLLLSCSTFADGQEQDSSATVDPIESTQTFTTNYQSGIASWYGHQFNGRKTANGERFNMNAMTAAHKSLPFNCKVLVTNQNNGQSVVVKINDRGPYVGNRIIDLSYAAAKEIGIAGTGISKVTLKVLK